VKLNALFISLFSILIVYPDCGYSKDIFLQSHEANYLGFTYDGIKSSDKVKKDGPYIDYQVSIKHPICHDCENQFYLAFTHRGAFYALPSEKKRSSSPVVGKKYVFQPVFFRRGNSYEYTDIRLTHESNGQSIDDSASYDDFRILHQTENNDADFARKFISRGWNYPEIEFQRKFGSSKLYWNANFKFLQIENSPEEYNAWEGGEGKARKETDGVLLGLKYNRNGSWLKKANFFYNTGISGFSKNNTYSAELVFRTFKKLTIDIMFRCRKGYNSDLIDYYMDIDSCTVAVVSKTDRDEPLF